MKIKYNNKTKRFSVIGMIGAIMGIFALSIILSKKKTGNLKEDLDRLIDGYDSGRFLRYDTSEELPSEYIPLFKIPKPDKRDKNLADINFTNEYYSFSDNLEILVDSNLDLDGHDMDLMGYFFEKVTYDPKLYSELFKIIKSGKLIDELELPTDTNKSTIEFKLYDCGKYGTLEYINKHNEVFFEYNGRLKYANEAIGINQEVIDKIIIPRIKELLIKDGRSEYIKK